LISSAPLIGAEKVSSSFVDFRPSPEQERLRSEVREFLRKDPALGERPFLEDGWIAGFDPAFSRRLGDRGWIGLTWPKEYGGAGRSYLDRLIVTEELVLAGAPVAAHWFGDRQIGPALLAHGTEAQRRELLPRIVRGEVVFCVGMSEPNAGSDLAALQTRARIDGDEFVISGQKTWTSFATDAEYCYLVARTDPDSAPHKGISEILVPMDAPGIRVSPIRDMVGEDHFGEVFFDEVRVPRTGLIGELNRGWYQIMQQLDFERSGIERLISNNALWRDVRALARERGRTRDPALRQRMARVEIGLCAGRWMIYKVASILSAGASPNTESSAAKAFCTELEQEIADLCAEILGPAAVLARGSHRAVLQGRAARTFLYAPAYTIQGGTNNILRNIVATRALGLPAR
jgi:alkylation response protein AidB-like acyl-CoA dehydrogenase